MVVTGGIRAEQVGFVTHEMQKGKSIYVEGKIKTDSWQDEQGNKKYRTRIRVQNMTMLGGSGGGSGSGDYSPSASEPAASAPSSQPAAPAAPVQEDNSIDDLPF